MPTLPRSLRDHFSSFGLVAVQLALVLAVAYQFEIEEQKLFLPVLALAAGGFVIHAWLPLGWRAWFFSLLSLGGILFVLGWPNGAWVIGLGGVLIALCRLPVPLGLRVAALAAAGLVLAGLRVEYATAGFWPVLGSMFMFRLIVYVFETRHDRGRPPLAQTLAYFFPLPNVCFPLFPVLDWRTFRETYYDCDEYDIYQTGVGWVVRGMSHLLAYRFVKYYLLPAPYDLRDGFHVALFLAANYALYLRVSGWFHMITGLLHLYGFNLPRTHDHYFLASSFSDVWRRINIYWKDFMAKVFFFPAYFALRGWGARAALTGAALVVFVATWLLHSYQMFWLVGDLSLGGGDAVLWLAAGLLVAVNIQFDARRAEKAPPGGATPRWDWRRAAARALRTFGMFWLVSLFWACWSMPDFLKYVRLPGPTAAGAAAVAGAVVAAVVVGVFAQWAYDRLTRLGVFPVAMSFRSAAALHTLALGSLVLVASAPVARVFGPSAAAFASTMRLDLYTPAEAAPAVRGYYEEIADQHVQAGAFLGRLRGRTPPPDFGQYSEATRPSDDPVLGGELIPGWRGKLAFAPASINRLGMRDREGITVAKPAHTCRIALVGSSVVMGVGVGDGEVFKGILEDELNAARPADAPRFELLNFGRGRVFSLNQVRLVERKVFPFQPDAVYYFAHQDELYTPAKFMAGVVYLKGPLPYPFMGEVVRKAGVTADTPAEALERQFIPHGREVTLGLYRVLVGECRRRGVLPVWVYLPVPGISQSPAGADAIVEIAKEAGFEVVDLSDWSGGRPPAAVKLSAEDYHPNALGHRLIAGRLFAEMRRRPELVPANARLRP